MKKYFFILITFFICSVPFDLSVSYAYAQKEINFVKLDNLQGANLELFVHDSDLKQNISAKAAQLNFYFDATSLISGSLYPTSFKIEVYDVSQEPRRLLSIFRSTIVNARKAQNFRADLELLNISKTCDLEIDVFDTKDLFYSRHKMRMEVESGSAVSFSQLPDSGCEGSFGECELAYIFQKVHLTVLPGNGLETKVERNNDGTYSVNLPLYRSKKIKLKNVLVSSDGSSGTDNQDFSFDFDGSNLFVIKDGVSTLIGATGPAGKKGEPGSPGPMGAAGPAGSFSGGDASITGNLTFSGLGQITNGVLNGTLAYVTGAANGYVLTSDANGFARWSSIGAVINGSGLGSGSNSSGIAGAVQFSDGNNGFNSDASNFFWNDSTNILNASIVQTGYGNFSVPLIRLGDNSIGFGQSSVNLYGRASSTVVWVANTNRFTVGSSQILSWTSSGGAETTVDTGIARNSAGIVEVNSGTSGAYGALRIGTQSAATQPLIVRAAAAQTANLTEWHNSTGTVRAFINSTGGKLNLASGAATMTASGVYNVIGAYVDTPVAAFSHYAYVVGPRQFRYGWNNSNSWSFSPSHPDTTLASPSAGSVSLGGESLTGATRYNLLVHNTYTDASNYERAVLDWKTTVNTFRIGTEALGTGMVRDIRVIGGNVAIGDVAPARKLHVSDAMRLQPLSGSQPSSPSMGDLYMDGDTGTLCLYDGTAWVAVAGGTSTCN